MEYIHTSNELDLESAINLLEKHLQNGEVDVLIVLADLYSKAGNPLFSSPLHISVLFFFYSFSIS